MNPQQMQKWEAIRAQGRRSYLLKRTLLWGTILSFAAIAQSAFSRFIFAKPIADTIFYAIFAKEHIADKEKMMDRFITSELSEVFGCFLVTGFIALAVWTYKEQRYAAAKYEGCSLTSNER
jgi:hypothetical protein